MDYNLALKLKEAGFPQIWPKPDFMNIKDAIKITDIYNGYPNEIYPYRPTLSELIEACGDDFLGLNRYPNPGTTQWFASSYNWDTSGSTHEEAVANLWLALNKK